MIARKVHHASLRSLPQTHYKIPPLQVCDLRAKKRVTRFFLANAQMYLLGKSITFCYSATWQGNRNVDYYVECVAGAVAQNVAPLK